MMPDRSLDSLSSAFYPKACEVIARVAARGVQVLVIQTSRTQAEHMTNLVAETSGTSLSLHLPRRLRLPTLAGLVDGGLGLDADKADAMDLAPYSVFQRHGPDKVNWDGHHPDFAVIGEESEHVGCRWGGRWARPYDPGHLELVLPVKREYLLAERARPWPTFRRA